MRRNWSILKLVPLSFGDIFLLSVCTSPLNFKSILYLFENCLRLRYYNLLIQRLRRAFSKNLESDVVKTQLKLNWKCGGVEGIREETKVDKNFFSADQFLRNETGNRNHRQTSIVQFLRCHFIEGGCVFWLKTKGIEP